MFAAHRPAFAIKLKRALHGGEWASLQDYFNEAVRASKRLQARGREADNPGSTSEGGKDETVDRL
jgi:hypothetical protein